MVAVMSVLILIYASNNLVRILAEVDSGDLQANILALMLSLKTISALSILMPLALFLAVLLAFGRLYKDNEAVAMEACAVSPRTSLHAVLGFAVVVALLVALLALFVAPWAEERTYQIQDRQRASSELVGLVSGRFIEPRTTNGVVYAEEISADHKSMQNIFIQGVLPDNQQRQVILAARSGQQRHDQRSGDNFIVLENGYRYEGTPGERDSASSNTAAIPCASVSHLSIVPTVSIVPAPVPACWLWKKTPIWLNYNGGFQRRSRHCCWPCWLCP